MYNLPSILLTLKGEHVDRDLTCESLPGYDGMNTELREFFPFFKKKKRKEKVGFVLF